LRHAFIPGAEQTGDVARVAPEHLLGPDAGEHDGRDRLCRLRQQVRGEDSRVGHRVVAVPSQQVEQLGRVRFDGHLPPRQARPQLPSDERGVQRVIAERVHREV